MNETYGRLQAVLELFSMNLAGRLTVFTTDRQWRYRRQCRCSIYPKKTLLTLSDNILISIINNASACYFCVAVG